MGSASTSQPQHRPEGRTAAPLARIICVCCATGALLVQGACTTYTPRPIDPAQTRAQLEARTLNDPDLARRLETLLPPPATVQPPVSWDQAELLVAAVEFNPTLLEARAHVAEAAGAVTSAHAIPNPNLALSSEYDLARYAESPWLWGASVGFLLDTTLRRRLRTEVAQSGVRAAQLDYAEALWSVRRELRAALLAAVVAERRIELLSAAERDRVDLVRLIGARVEAGEAAAPERLQAQLELTRTRAALADARLQLEDARARVAGVIGVPAPALMGVALRWDALEAPASPDGARLQTLRADALLTRTDLAHAVSDYQVRELELQQQVRAQYPEVTVAPGYLYDHGIRKATLGISFNLPVFNRNQGPIAEALARREEAGDHLLVVQEQILNQVDAARAQLSVALDALGAARQQRLDADALTQSVARAVAAGADDRPSLLAARLTASADALAELDAIDHAQQALGQLEDALRTPLAGAEMRLRLDTEPPGTSAVDRPPPPAVP
jgi:outer membrane protein TolC